VIKQNLTTTIPFQGQRPKTAREGFNKSAENINEQYHPPRKEPDANRSLSQLFFWFIKNAGKSPKPIVNSRSKIHSKQQATTPGKNSLNTQAASLTLTPGPTALKTITFYDAHGALKTRPISDKDAFYYDKQGAAFIVPKDQVPDWVTPRMRIPRTTP
jgi:hypothetical protein